MLKSFQKHKKASITDITEENFTLEDLTYSCLAGISGELYEMYKIADKKCTKLVGTGNGIRKNPILMKLFEEKFGMKMQIPLYTEEAAIGAALFALVSCGKYNDIYSIKEVIKYL